MENVWVKCLYHSWEDRKHVESLLTYDRPRNKSEYAEHSASLNSLISTLTLIFFCNTYSNYLNISYDKYM